MLALKLSVFDAYHEHMRAISLPVKYYSCCSLALAGKREQVIEDLGKLGIYDLRTISRAMEIIMDDLDAWTVERCKDFMSRMLAHVLDNTQVGNFNKSSTRAFHS